MMRLGSTAFVAFGIFCYAATVDTVKAHNADKSRITFLRSTPTHQDAGSLEHTITRRHLGEQNVTEILMYEEEKLRNSNSTSEIEPQTTEINTTSVDEKPDEQVEEQVEENEPEEAPVSGQDEEPVTGHDEEHMNVQDEEQVEGHDEEPVDRHDSGHEGHEEAYGNEHGDGHGDGHGDEHGDEHGDGHGGEHLGVHVPYEDIYAILVFLICATGLGKLFELLGMPALVGEIFTGFLLGPPLLDFVPWPDAMVLVGEIGLIMLLLEAGVEIDVGQLKQTGTRALGIACTGSLLPLVAGFGIATAAGQSWKSALAIGAAFSPTSLGVASKALGSGGMLNTPVGQLIVASCVVDDTIALVILSMFQVLVAENPAIYEYFIPIISAFGFLVLLGGLAVTFWPWLLEQKLLPRFPEQHQDTVMFSIMALVLVAYLPLLNYTRASYLTGAFLAGMSFSQIHSAHDAFIQNTHQLMMWLLRVFFAASIGFQIPITRFGSGYVIGWGFALYVAVLMKLPLGYFVPKFQDTPKDASFNPYTRDLVVTGLAMSCRGEFSFIIASFGLSEGLYGPDLYSAVVWAVLLSCATSPFLLLNSIKYFNKKQAKYLAETNPLKMRTLDDKTSLHLHIRIKSNIQWGMQEKFHQELQGMKMLVLDHRTEHGRGLKATVTTDIYVRDDGTRIQLPTIERQRKATRAIRSISSGNSIAVSRLSKKVSSGNMLKLASANSLGSLEASASNANLSNEEKMMLAQMLQQKDKIEDRAVQVKGAMEQILNQDDAHVEVTEWDPWDWSEAFDAMLAKQDGNVTLDDFMALFDRIDSDGGGTVDQDELYDALRKAGVKISKDGLATMIAMVDENNDGEISREEWRQAVDFYFEKKDYDRKVHSNLPSNLTKNRVVELEKMEYGNEQTKTVESISDSIVDSEHDVGLAIDD